MPDHLFTDIALTKAVNDAFLLSSGIPADHRGAFVTVANKDGIKAVVAHKINERWVITAQVDHPWSGNLNAGATIQATW